MVRETGSSHPRPRADLPSHGWLKGVEKAIHGYCCVSRSTREILIRIEPLMASMSSWGGERMPFRLLYLPTSLQGDYYA